MGRIIQPKGDKGSLKWIQRVVNDSPPLLSKPLKTHLGLPENVNIEWLSPIKKDGYAEYRDQAFLDLLNIEPPKRPLKDFWPGQGPQWDASGRIGDKAYFLVEAKGHISELVSASQSKSGASRSLINKSLNETKEYLKLNPCIDLSKGFYQYFNRLSHLYLLRKLNGIPAYLVFVYFINDHTHIPISKEEWSGALKLMHTLLGTNNHTFQEYVIKVFIDVEKLMDGARQ